MKCSKCGGNVISMQHAVYYTDGSSSGSYQCQKCGAMRGWRTQGLLYYNLYYNDNEIVDMEEE